MLEIICWYTSTKVYICTFFLRTYRIRWRRTFLVVGWLLPVRRWLIFLRTRRIVLHLRSSTALRLMDFDASSTKVSTTNPTRNGGWHVARSNQWCSQSFKLCVVVLGKNVEKWKEKNKTQQWLNNKPTVFGVALQLLSWIGNRSGKNVLPHFAHGINCSWKVIQIFEL